MTSGSVHVEMSGDASAALRPNIIEAHPAAHIRRSSQGTDPIRDPIREHARRLAHELAEYRLTCRSYISQPSRDTLASQHMQPVGKRF